MGYGNSIFLMEILKQLENLKKGSEMVNGSIIMKMVKSIKLHNIDLGLSMVYGKYIEDGELVVEQKWNNGEPVN